MWDMWDRLSTLNSNLQNRVLIASRVSTLLYKGNSDFHLIPASADLNLPSNAIIDCLIPLGYGPHSSWDTFITFRKATSTYIEGHTHGSLEQYYDINYYVVYHM